MGIQRLKIMEEYHESWYNFFRCKCSRCTELIQAHENEEGFNITQDNIRGEIDTGAPVGKEIW